MSIMKYGFHNLTCAKICYPSRKKARKATNLIKGHHLRPYQCGDHWHIGHLAEPVIKGHATADQIYPPVTPDGTLPNKIT